MEAQVVVDPAVVAILVVEFDEVVADVDHLRLEPALFPPSLLCSCQVFTSSRCYPEIKQEPGHMVSNHPRGNCLIGYIPTDERVEV